MKNRYDFILLFDVKDANPNGDPDAGNLPRIDAETGQGLVTDVCLKRKVRNFIQATQPEQRIYFHEGAVHNLQHENAYQGIGKGELSKEEKKKPKAEVKKKARGWMCDQFWDVRTFGAVMSTDVNCGQVRGPVQLSFARSVDPIVVSEHAITRSSVTNEVDIQKERTMGRKFTVPYAVYRAHGFVNPFLAQQTGFTDADLSLLFAALEKIFELDASAARPAGSMAMRGFLVFKHDNELGKAPSHKLFDAVTVKKRNEVEVARDFSDYRVTIDETSVPEGVTLIRKIDPVEITKKEVSQP